jgi:hypothetical protein
LPGDFHIDRPENLDLVNWIINQGFVEPVMKTFSRPVPRKGFVISAINRYTHSVSYIPLSS